MYLKAWIDRDSRANPSMAWLLRQFETWVLEDSEDAMLSGITQLLCNLDLAPREWDVLFQKWRSRQVPLWSWPSSTPTAETLAAIFRSFMLGREPREGED